MLKNLLRALRRQAPSPEADAYRQRALAALAEAEWRDRAWLESAPSTSDYGALANLAAVYRWELSLLSRQFSALQPPSELRQEAADCQRVIALTARAFHCMTSGYRFSKFERVCDGHTLLEEARRKRQRLAARLRSTEEQHAHGDASAARTERQGAALATEG